MKLVLSNLYNAHDAMLEETEREKQERGRGQQANRVVFYHVFELLVQLVKRSTVACRIILLGMFFGGALIPLPAG